MARQSSTDRNGCSFSEAIINQVWAKGSVIPGFSSNIWRWDRCGSVMKFSDYGNRDSKYGWEIDHITPVAYNGDDKINNLQPLNWENNLKKSDSLNFDYQR